MSPFMWIIVLIVCLCFPPLGGALIGMALVYMIWLVIRDIINI